ncbi:sigma-70 family RNA polymerase sigma factor [Viridibacillus arvi]|uniref:sigma-70 family RNA polymerase sigma factor n=1 Tax=Viridibacillus arvi TaxID=263475 RepID=UPI00187B9987|nr:sigma-70 family RNA polymerase sigma factor [Viridibacillus sp. JNUCC-6]QOV13188.1 sigma-70 family RNA polymerase sigma factor [Viridibacillus sp. JNUCC-6]
MEPQELAQQAIKGDDTAFLAIMQLYKNDLYRTAYAFLKNEHDAIEAVQEVTVRAYQKIHTLKEPAYTKTWLIRIMINYCQNQIAKNKRFTSNEKLQEIATMDDTRFLELNEAMASLSKKDQQLITLKYLQNTKIKDIAVLENIPEGTVKSRLHKALQSLRTFWSKGGENTDV